MKSIFCLFAIALLTPSLAAAGPTRNCRPEDRLPGKRCADEWAHKDEGGAGKDSNQTEDESEGDDEEIGQP